MLPPPDGLVLFGMGEPDRRKVDVGLKIEHPGLHGVLDQFKVEPQ